MIPVFFIIFGTSIGFTFQLHQKLPNSLDLHLSRELTANISDKFNRLLVQNALLYCPGTDMCIPQYNRNYSFQNDTFECCGRCKCDKSCYKEGTCCPTLYLERNETNLPQNSSLFKYKSEKISDALNCLYPEVMPQLTSMNVPNAKPSYLMVWKCPDIYKDATISVMCKEAGKSLNPDMDIKLVIPVTSFRTNVTYRNVYCAQCHGERELDLVVWEGEVFCPLLGKFAAQSFHEILSKIIINQKCNLMFDPVSTIKHIPKFCDWGTFTECNVTGRWDVYDPMIEAGCHGYKMTYLHHYRNVFCFMCNENEEPWNKCTFGDFKGIGHAFRPDAFSGKIDFKNAQSLFSIEESHSNDLQDGENCPQGTKFDHFKEKCRSLTCSANLAYNGSHCRSIFDRVNQQMYELYIQFTPGNPKIFTECEICVLSAVNAMSDHVKQFLSEAGYDKDDLCKFQILYKTLNGLPLQSDKLVNISQIIIHVVVYVNNYHDYTKLLIDFLKIETKMVLLNFNISSLDVSAEFDVRLIYGGSEFEDEDYSFLPVKIQDNEIRTMYNHPKLYEIQSTSRQCFMFLRTTEVTKFKSCPRITLSSNEFTIVETNRTCVREISLCLEPGQHSRLINGSVKICSEVYFERIEKLRINRKNNGTNDEIGIDKQVPEVLTNTLTNAQYLSLYCTSLSLVALIITIFGFVRTKKYRTLTGKINMLLLIMFGFAQLFQELSSLTNKVKTICELAGAITHFAWIVTAFWINAACFNILKIFLLKSRLFQGISEIKHLLIFLAYAVVMSSLFVTVCILTNFVVTNGSHTGYGGVWCFIISNEIFLYTYILPIAITALVNIVIVIIVVAKYGIYVHTKLKIAFHYRMLKRYVLLAIIFALTATLRTIYQWKPLMVILYTTIGLNAAQSLLFCLLLFCIKTNHQGLPSQSYYLDKYQNEHNATTADSHDENNLQSLHGSGNQDVQSNGTPKSAETQQDNVMAVCYNSNDNICPNSNDITPQHSNNSTPQNDKGEWKLKLSEANIVCNDNKPEAERKTLGGENRRNETSADTPNVATVLDHSDVILSEAGYCSSHM